MRYANRIADYGTTVYVDKAQQFIRTTRGQAVLPLPERVRTAPAGDSGAAGIATGSRPRQAPRTPSFNLDRPGQARVGFAVCKRLNGTQVRRPRRAVSRTVAVVASGRPRRRRARSARCARPTSSQNTYFVFSSDNGFHLGQFHMPAGKETAVRHRHPRAAGRPRARRTRGRERSTSWSATSISRRRSRNSPASGAPSFVDGRSFAPLLHDPHRRSAPRRAYLLEHWRPSMASRRRDRGRTNRAISTSRPRRRASRVAGFDFIPGYRGVRTEHYMYVEYSSTSRELYAIDSDPYEIFNLASDPQYRASRRRVARTRRPAREM